jgi:hypothetical protein
VSVKGDVFSFDSFRDPVFLSKTLVYVNVSQRAYGWCTQPACTYMRTRILEPCLPPETGEHPSLSSGLSDAPWHKRRRPGSLGSENWGDRIILDRYFSVGCGKPNQNICNKKIADSVCTKKFAGSVCNLPPSPGKLDSTGQLFNFLRPGSALAQPNF